MRDYVTLIAGNVTLVKDGDKWHCNGEIIDYPWDVVHDVIAGHDYFDVTAIRDNGTVDVIEYYAGYRHHVTRGVNR